MSSKRPLGRVTNHQRARVCLEIHGAVQGVGFRPFIFGLAKSLNLSGFVINNPHGVSIDAEGRLADIRSFVLRIDSEKPPAAAVYSIEPTFVDLHGYSDFKILESKNDGNPSTVIMTDLATCPSCLGEMNDPRDRRYRYPFINCTHCGPRYSIVLGLPYDRQQTTMAGFEMCDECLAEYGNPTDRRFHAQPIACPNCGPQLELWDQYGHTLAAQDEALKKAAGAISNGAIVALKGIGGFQLLVDATSESSVHRLRLRKNREEKPFAVMYGSLADIESHCQITEIERRLLVSPQSPIVLAKRKGKSGLAPSVAPGNPDIGVLLPYSPLHHLLLSELNVPVVATSGNISEEPICIDEARVVQTLGEIADFYLVHNRPIARHVDDSVVRVMGEREVVIRRARGYAPLPLPMAGLTPPILALGAHQKSTVGLSVGSMAVLSQHIGDLDTVATWNTFQAVIGDLERMYSFEAVAVACDQHPDYRSTGYALSTGKDVISIQHHHAHILSCMADNHLSGEVLGIAWDGTGYGDDGTIWGGECLKVDDYGFSRFASLLPFRLPGGDKAVREPRRIAAGLLFECFGTDCLPHKTLPTIVSFTTSELSNIGTMLERGINSPLTTSMGRLFDGVAAILGVRDKVRHEGQAAMELEFLARASVDQDCYALPLSAQSGSIVADWRPMVVRMIDDHASGAEAADLARRFHNSLGNLAVDVALLAGIKRVVMSGGCFQNRLLTELCILRLRNAGFTPYWHQRVPPNDGGISLGQLFGAAQILRGK